MRDAAPEGRSPLRTEVARTFFSQVEPDLPEDGFIPAASAVFGWDTTPVGGSRLVCNFTAFYRPAHVWNDPELRALWRGCTDFAAMTGDTRSDWLNSPSQTPAAVFGAASARGFLSKAEQLRALGAMAQIRECAWAREWLLTEAAFLLDWEGDWAATMSSRRSVDHVASALIERAREKDRA
jgi:hypothetical protein